MSSTSKPSEVTYEPLSEGNYILVDITEVVEPYLALPKKSRMAGFDASQYYSKDIPFSDADMLDIELSALVPCLDSDDQAPREMKEHIENLLDDGKEQIEFLLKEQGVETERRTILNTPEQLDHAKAIDKMAKKLHEVFHEHKLYSESGLLIGEHCTLLEGNLLVLRET